jgi:hypothetical protein
MSPVALAWQQFRFERKLFWRNPSAAFFNFLLPLLLLVLTASAFSADHEELEILIPGIAGMGVLATTFTSLAFNITVLRDDGVLKRWRGTPMPAGSYLAGLLASAALNAFAQVLLVVAIGNVAYGVDWPQDPMLLTTHYLDEAQELADRVAFVKDGRIVAEGPPDSLGPGSSRYRVSYISQGRRVEHQTDDPTELLFRLTSDAMARGERLEGLEVTRPTLEEVYLELTREADAA